MSANLQNSIESLRRELRKIKYSKNVDYQALLSGDHHAFISLYRMVLCDYSSTFMKHLLDSGYELTGISDYKFLETLYKILRDLFSYRPKLSSHQFFSAGYKERKLEMATDIISNIVEYISTINPQTAAVKAFHSSSVYKSTISRRMSSNDGIEVHEYGDLSTQPTHKQRPTSAGNSTKSYSMRSVNKKGSRASRGRGGGLGISAPRSRSASGSNSPGRSSLKKSNSFIISKPKTGDANFDENNTDEEGNQLNILNTILDSNDSDNKQSRQQESNKTKSGSITQKQRSPVSKVEQDSWTPMNKQIHDSVLKIASQLDNILARVTLVETRIQNIEDTISSREANDFISESNYGSSNIRPHSTVVSVVESSGQPNNKNYRSLEVIPSVKHDAHMSSAQPKLYQGSLQSTISAIDTIVSRPYSSTAGINRSIPTSTAAYQQYSTVNGYDKHRPATSTVSLDKEPFRNVLSSPVSVSVSSASPYDKYSSIYYEGGRTAANGNYGLDYKTMSLPYTGEKNFSNSHDSGFTKSPSIGSKPPTGYVSHIRSRSPSPLPPANYQAKFTLNRMESDEKKMDTAYSTSGSLKENADQSESKTYATYKINVGNQESVGDKENFSAMGHNGENSTPPHTYRSQADRIAAMLADTQTLLVNK